MIRHILPTAAIIWQLTGGFALGAPANLLSNPGFELGDGGGPLCDQRGVGKRWETVCGGPHPEIYAIDTQVKHSGKNSQRMTCAGYNFDADEGRCYSIGPEGKHVCHPMKGVVLGFQAIAQTTKPGVIKPGCRYRLSAWVKIDGLTSKWEWFRLCIYWLDRDGKFIEETREPKSDKGNYGTHDWKLLQAEGVAPSGAAYAKAYLHHHFEHGTVWYDDVELCELPPSNRSAL